MYIIKPTLNYNCQQCVTGSRQAILWPWGKCSSEVFCSSRIQSLVLRMFCIYEKMQTSQSVKTKTDYVSILILFLVCMGIRKAITFCLFSLKIYYQSHLKLSVHVFWETSKTLKIQLSTISLYNFCHFRKLYSYFSACYDVYLISNWNQNKK